MKISGHCQTFVGYIKRTTAWSEVQVVVAVFDLHIVSLINFVGINLNQRAVIHKNLHKIQALDRAQEITSMAWGNEQESEVSKWLRFAKILSFLYVYLFFFFIPAPNVYFVLSWKVVLCRKLVM